MKQQVKNKESVTVESAPSAPAAPVHEMEQLAHSLLSSRRQQSKVVARLQEMWSKAVGRDFLIVHSPGGWGNTQWEGLLDWEKSIVTGVTSTLEKLGYSSNVVQYFRSGERWIDHVRDVFKEAQFFLGGRSARADVMSGELKFLAEHQNGTRIILVGASQGAAFDNAVMQRLGDNPPIYSIELGTFFPHMKRRTITPRTLAIDGNGLMRDPMCERDLWAGTRSYVRGIFRWSKYVLRGKRVKFTHCINTPGHEYQWEYPAVHTNITDFLTGKFGGH